jgi:pimeloyl-ACP methyl ester carboxylesterase
MAVKRFAYIEWKNGPTVLRGSLHCTHAKGGTWFIFCHGFTGHRLGPGYFFVRLARDLAKAGFSSLRFDFSGCGESEGAFRNMTIDTMKSDLLSAVRLVRRKFAPSRIILIGHSLGGMIAGLCCNKAKADGLALLSPVADPQGLIKRRAAIIEAGPNTRGFYENGPHEMAHGFLDGLKRSDPVAEVAANFHGNLLLLQGDCDVSISVVESGRYVNAARGMGIETVYHILKGADHNYSSVSHFKTISATVASWAKERFR